MRATVILFQSRRAIITECYRACHLGMISTRLNFEDIQEACQKFQLFFLGKKNVGQQCVCDFCLAGKFSQIIREPRQTP